AVKGARLAGPLFSLAQEGDQGAPAGGDIALLGEGPLREVLAGAMGAPGGTPQEATLTVAIPPDAAQAGAHAAILAARRARERGVLAVLVGDEAHRDALEEALTLGHGLELSDLVHVAALDDEGLEMVLDAVAGVLADDAVGVARRTPALRPAIGARLVEDASRRAGLVGALPIGGADLPALAVIQVRMVAHLAAAHDRPRGMERALEALAVAGSGFGWRAIGRTAVKFVPVAGWAAGGGVAYGATRAMGTVALKRLAAGHDPIDAGPLDRVRPQIDRLLARVGRGGDGAHKESH
ncbi:MAG: hypothetical protein RJQ03_11040, partial [Miltoncostaeaceae bacterium]